MINASKAYKQKLKNGGNLVNYADIILRDGTNLNLTYKDFMLGGCTVSDKTTGSSEFSIGNTVGKTISLCIANHDNRYSSYDFCNAVIYLYVAMRLDDGTIEKICKGKYYVNEPETPGDVIEIDAVDAMINFDRSYAESGTSYPATLQTILTDACMDCNVRIGFRQFDNYNFVVSEKPENVSYRQVVSFVAQIAGYNARINNDDALELVWYNTTLLDRELYNGGIYTDDGMEVIIDGGLFTTPMNSNVIDGGLFTDDTGFNVYSFKSLTVGTDDVVITGVKVVGDEKEYLKGSEGYVITLEGNPFTVGKEQTVANYLGLRMIGMRFRPFTGQIPCNPLYEPFDTGYITDRKNNTYQTIINSVDFTIGSHTTISCEAESPLRNTSRYYSEAARAIVAARRETDKKLSNYDKMVQQLNAVATNAMGFHVTNVEQTDGSRIVYLHDKPSLSDSKVIYKQTIDGFFLSTDGGKNYTAGFDSSGNAVVNILSAVGIVCDWIKGGTLTLGGDNNIDGSCVVYDASGKEVAKLDKNGLSTNSANITGGKINISTSDEGESAITLRGIFGESEYYLYMYPAGITVARDGVYSSVKAGNILMHNGSMNCTYDYTGIFFDTSHYFKQYGLRMGNTEIGNGNIKLLSGTDAFVSMGSVKTDINGWSFVNGRLYNNREISFGDNACFIKTNAYFGSDSQIKLASDGSIHINSYGDIMASNNELIIDTVWADYLYISGSKSRIASTENYFDRLLYCYETPKPYFGDIGEATLDENGLCYVFLDDIFYETVNTDCKYQVFLQKYGQGDVWIKERTPTYFIVEGTPNLSFGWEIKARQLGFESERLEVFTRQKKEETINYELEAQNYIENYYKEMLNYEESN